MIASRDVALLRSGAAPTDRNIRNGDGLKAVVRKEEAAHAI
jgi:hypothetical protein